MYKLFGYNSSLLV